jgi:hypothetical protein
MESKAFLPVLAFSLNAATSEALQDLLETYSFTQTPLHIQVEVYCSVLDEDNENMTSAHHRGGRENRSTKLATQ